MDIAVVDIPARDPSDIEAYIRGEGCSILPWSDPPGRHWAPHSHGHDEVIGVVEGRIDFVIDGETFPLVPGKILYLPAGTVHAADVPPGAGVRYLVGSR